MVFAVFILPASCYQCFCQQQFMTLLSHLVLQIRHSLCQWLHNLLFELSYCRCCCLSLCGYRFHTRGQGSEVCKRQFRRALRLLPHLHTTTSAARNAQHLRRTSSVGRVGHAEVDGMSSRGRGDRLSSYGMGNRPGAKPFIKTTAQPHVAEKGTMSTSGAAHTSYEVGQHHPVIVTHSSNFSHDVLPHLSAGHLQHFHPLLQRLVRLAVHAKGCAAF